MRTTEVLIHNYKSIRSEVAECRLVLDDTVTILIGGNESGKTNILEALTKFPSGEFEEADIPYASPAAEGAQEARHALPMVSVVFHLDNRDKQVLGEVYGEFTEQETVAVTRYFSGRLFIDDPQIDTEVQADQLLNDLKRSVGLLRRPFQLNMNSYNRRRTPGILSSRSASSRFTVFASRIEQAVPEMSQSAIKTAQAKLGRVQDAVESLEPRSERISKQVLQPLTEIHDKLRKLAVYAQAHPITEHLGTLIPSFLMVGATPQHWLRGEYAVTDIIGKGTLDRSLQGVRHLLSLAELDLEAVTQLSTRAQVERLEKASKRVTMQLQSVWHEEQSVEINLDWSPIEGNKKLLITILSSGHRGSPEQRSNGFRWFLEFYLLYATGTARERPLVLLLEEPGIYLHPSVQDDLKSLIREKVAREHQAIYTTHLPGMYDHEYPEHARGVRKTSSDPSVTVIDSLYDPEKQMRSRPIEWCKSTSSC